MREVKMIIDFHTHAFPDSLAPRAIPALAESSSLTPNHDGTICGLTKALDESGVEKAVVLSIATKPHQENSVNTFAISLLENPRIIPFGSVFPGSDTWREQLARLRDAGIKGIKLHPEYQGFFIDSDDAMPIYEECGKLGLIVTFHAGADAAFPPPVHASPERLSFVCSSFPSTTFTAAHFGGYGIWDEVASKLKGHDNLYIDTSMTQTADRIERKTALRILKTHGTEHILFGSDSPWEKQSDSMRFVRSFGLSDSDEELIFSKNAKRILNI